MYYFCWPNTFIWNFYRNKVFVKHTFSRRHPYWKPIKHPSTKQHESGELWVLIRQPSAADNDAQQCHGDDRKDRNAASRAPCRCLSVSVCLVYIVCRQSIDGTVPYSTYTVQYSTSRQSQQGSTRRPSPLKIWTLLVPYSIMRRRRNLKSKRKTKNNKTQYQRKTTTQRKSFLDCYNATCTFHSLHK